MERTMIKDIRAAAGKEAKVCGFVENFRDGKSMAFIVLKDITGKLQITVEKEKCPQLLDELAKITPDS
ncbi:MAG: aspartate--tRNA(Asn) ligase, partial [Clostridia bacterium]|nr:aspartate--tRNA(Asn) ligase [Clostridia bacterium]